MNDKFMQAVDQFEIETRQDERISTLADVIAFLCPKCQECDFPTGHNFWHLGYGECEARDIWEEMGKLGIVMGEEAVRQRINVNQEASKPPDERIEDLYYISVRTKAALLGAGIVKMSQLARKSRKELLEIRGFGKRCLQEVVELLSELNLKLQGD